MVDKTNIKKESLRNLPQYAEMSEEEFELFWEQRKLNMQPDVDFEKLIDAKMSEFEEDYDLTDMKSNDILTLRALCQAMIFLELYNQRLYRLIGSGDDKENSSLVNSYERRKNDLMRSISSLQEDLDITRKIRKSGKEETVLQTWEDLQKKAKKYLEKTLLYIYCENDECKFLLGNVWALYGHKHNLIRLECENCGNKTTVYTDELIKSGGRNRKDVPNI